MPIAKERLNEMANCSEISFLSNFKILFGILYGPLEMLISRKEIINPISSLLVGERKKELRFSFVS